MIGVFTAHLNNAYQADIWRGIESGAERLGIGVINFVGSTVGSSIPTETTANIAYRIADPAMIDGLIIISAAIGLSLDSTGLAQEFASRQGIPTVSVGIGLPGASRVAVDSAGAIAEAVHHLVHDHGRRRFALISGPRDHEEVHARREAFLTAVEREGLRLEARLDRSGFFSRESGMEAARELMQSGAPFDALFCMNDLMAIGAIDALRAAGLRVPHEVAVVGFDGIEEGRTLVHPLTSVVQPLFALGATSVEMLGDLMAGGTLEDRLLKCVLSIHESCGCPPARPFRPNVPAIPEDATPRDRRVVADLAGRALRGDEDGFIVQLNEAVTASALEGRDPARWNDLLSFVHCEVDRALGSKRDEPGSLFESARALVVAIDARVRDGRRAIAQERFKDLRSISSSLAASFEIDAILDQLRAALDRLGIGAGYVALFAEPGSSIDWSTLVLAPHGAKTHRRRFRSAELLPAELGLDWRRQSWVFEPLIFQHEPLGYMLLPGGVEEPATYDSLRDQVSRALKGALLVEQVRTHERHLEDEVSRRTREISRTNAELKREVLRRVRLEREIVAISNRTMERIGQDLHDDLCQHLAGVAMHALSVRDALEKEEHPKVDAMRRIGDLLSDSIVRVREIARGLMPAGLEHRGLTAAIMSMVESARSSYPVTIDFRVSPEFSLPDTDRAFQVYRIVQEALTNALKHSGARRIAVTLGCEEPDGDGTGIGSSMLVAEVVDTGSALPRRVSTDGMGLRIMRYRAAQAGAELRVEHGGAGTRVTCRIPQNPRAPR